MIDVRMQTVDVGVNFFHGATITFTNSEVFVPGNEGCTPGFWKNNPGQWDGTGYKTDDKSDTVFDVTLFGPDLTLLQALKLYGGGMNAMTRHAVAALLNAANCGVDASLSVDGALLSFLVAARKVSDSAGSPGSLVALWRHLEAGLRLSDLEPIVDPPGWQLQRRYGGD